MDKKQRQEQLFQAIVQEYVKTARPVGSQTLVAEYGFDFSPATIRNDMAALESAGLIEQPYTSAGRIPTEKGYRYYIQYFLHKKALPKAKKQTIQRVVKENQEDEAQYIRTLARTLSDMTQEAVVVSVDGDQVYYTGMSYIFRKPEFAHSETVGKLGDALDRIEEVMEHMHGQLQNDMEILVGQQNPFARDCAVIVTTHAFIDDKAGMVGILGPMRMDYNTNIAILEYMESLMEDNHEQHS